MILLDGDIPDRGYLIALICVHEVDTCDAWIREVWIRRNKIRNLPTLEKEI